MAVPSVILLVFGRPAPGYERMLLSRPPKTVETQCLGCAGAGRHISSLGCRKLTSNFMAFLPPLSGQAQVAAGCSNDACNVWMSSRISSISAADRSHQGVEIIVSQPFHLGANGATVVGECSRLPHSCPASTVQFG